MKHRPVAATHPLEQLAARIRHEHSQAQEAIKMSLAHAIRCGELLTQAKAALPHGSFLPFLAHKCRLHKASAQIYMKLYRRFGNEKPSAWPFSIREALKLLAKSVPEDPRELPDEPAPLASDTAVSRLGDLWTLGAHRLLCGDAIAVEAVQRVLGDREPTLLMTDPPYGGDNDNWWRNLAGINEQRKRGVGHTQTRISGDARGEWSEAFELVPSLTTAYVWHQSTNTAAVLKGLLEIGFEHPTQIIWDKGRTALAAQHYSYEHEPLWYVRKKNSQWYGAIGENSTVWRSASPKVAGGPDDKVDHPNQKPLEFSRRPICLHTLPGELVYDPFLGSGTTLVACEELERVCLGIEIDPKFIDVIVHRWQQLTGKSATLNGRTFDEIAQDRQSHSCNEVHRLAAAG